MHFKALLPAIRGIGRPTLLASTFQDPLQKKSQAGMLEHYPAAMALSATVVMDIEPIIRSWINAFPMKKT